MLTSSPRCCSQSTISGTASTFAIAASQKRRSSQIQASTYEPSSSLASVTSISPGKFSFAASTIAPRLARNGCSWSPSTTYLLNSRVLLNVTSFCVADIMTTLNHDDNILSRGCTKLSKANDTHLRAEEVDRLAADVLECAGALRRYGDALTRPLGQTEVRWAVMSVLSGGARTVPQVARRLGVTRQSVQRVANLLAAEGLIESAPNPDNARSPLFRLSKRGVEVLTAITRAADPWLRRVGEEFSLDDLRRAREALAVLMRFARESIVR